METISFAEFQRMELVIGEVVEVLEIDGFDNLYYLKVDIGGQSRMIVAGIKQWYKREDLLGNKIVVLVNLDTKEIAGKESQGMLLAADDRGKPVLIMPCGNVPAGTKVR